MRKSGESLFKSKNKKAAIAITTIDTIHKAMLFAIKDETKIKTDNIENKKIDLFFKK